MEGLEINIRLKTQAFDLVYKSRIDPEFFQKKYVDYEKLISKSEYDILGDIAFVTDGEHGTAETFETGYSKYYGARNVLSGILNDNNVDFITKEHHQKLKKTALKPRDVLISCVGANIGYSAIVPDNIGIGNIVRNVALIRSTSNYINEYLHAYFLSKYGKSLYYRMNSGNAQPLVSLDYINTILVFKASIAFQERVRDIISSSINSLGYSKKRYADAETLLHYEIGLQDFVQNSEGINIKSFSESFLATGRLDAEYYQPKYDDYLSKVFSYKSGYDKIVSTCNIKLKNYNPADKKNYKYIELSNIGKTGDITGCTIDLGKELPSRARRKVNQGDVIVSSIEGSLDSCALVTEEYNDSLCSTGFYVINSQKINSETLLVLFKSELMQNLLKQNCSGTILTSLNKDDFLNIPIPIIDNETQKEIKNSIEESFALKKQSEHLLEVAKRAVEIAIKESEGVALDYINKNS